jgi:branched-chain amino acid transport system permease protein
LAFIISGFFAGVSGGMAVLHFEMVTADVVGTARSGAYLLFTILGGSGYFVGPLLGAVGMVLSGVLLSEWTTAGLLYLGLLFMAMVMYAPGGLAGLIMMNLRIAKTGALKRLLPSYAGLGVAMALMLAGAGALVEMIYHLQLDGGNGSQLPFAGWVLQTDSATTWGVSVALLAIGLLVFETVRRRFALIWGDIQTEIAAAQQAKEAS